MKNIKSVIILTVCLAVSTLVEAQQLNDVKAQVAPVAEIKLPPPVDVNQIPAPQTRPAEAEAGIQSAKPLLLQQPVNNPNSKLTPEQQKTANGTAQKPVLSAAPGTVQKPTQPGPAVLTTAAGQ